MSGDEVSGETLLYLADSLLAAGVQYGLWVERAPSVEEGISMSSMSQDKLGHARAFQQLAEKALGTSAVDLQYERAADAYTWNPAWTLPLPTWDHVVLAKALFARATFAEIEALPAASEAAALLPKLRQEEAWHWRHADAWLTRRADEDASAVQAVLDELWPMVVGYHGADSALSKPFHERVSALLTEAGLKPGPAEPDEARLTELTELARENAVELVALLQDPENRAVAEL